MTNFLNSIDNHLETIGKGASKVVPKAVREFVGIVLCWICILWLLKGLIIVTVMFPWGWLILFGLMFVFWLIGKRVKEPVEKDGDEDVE